MSNGTIDSLQDHAHAGAMTTDTRQIAAAAFYDFGRRAVIDVGEGGGSTSSIGSRGAGRRSRSTATPRSLGLLDRVRERVPDDTFVLVHRASGLSGRERSADVALLEFCLHLMAAPERVLAHARGLASDVVVIDNTPDSPWSWCVAEDAGFETDRRSERGSLVFPFAKARK
jgi:ubiquinone/menaquinone biosynthesis C-methylase UbiE